MLSKMVLSVVLVIVPSSSVMAADFQQEFSLSEKLLYAQVTTNLQPPSVVVVSQKSLCLLELCHS